MNYKGYTALIEFDTDDRVLHGSVIGINDVISFESDQASQIEREFHVSIDDYLEHCARIGKEPAKPFSGRFVVLVSPERHEAAALAAAAAGRSLNEWVDAALAAALGGREPAGAEARPRPAKRRASRSPETVASD